ncbi:hypothetical protein D3C73_1221700 [compost metagenome]
MQKSGGERLETLTSGSLLSLIVIRCFSLALPLQSSTEPVGCCFLASVYRGIGRNNSGRSHVSRVSSLCMFCRVIVVLSIAVEMNDKEKPPQKNGGFYLKKQNYCLFEKKSISLMISSKA